MMKNDLFAVALSYGIVFASIAIYFVFMAVRSRKLRLERAQLERKRGAAAPDRAPARTATTAAIVDPVPVGASR